jgi:hypothetical protein
MPARSGSQVPPAAEELCPRSLHDNALPSVAAQTQRSPVAAITGNRNVQPNRNVVNGSEPILKPERRKRPALAFRRWEAHLPSSAPALPTVARRRISGLSVTEGDR